MFVILIVFQLSSSYRIVLYKYNRVFLYTFSVIFYMTCSCTYILNSVSCKIGIIIQSR